MKANYKIVFLITLLTLGLSVSITFVNYMISFKNAENQLITQSLPLSVDNIYTDIQKHVIEPYLISSMMANDTFVKDWLVNDEDSSLKITKYLSSIKNKYGMFGAFLVSKKSLSYYTQDGFLEKVTRENPQNMWYFDFKDSQKPHEINLDFNKNLINTMMMFVNYKIYDDDYQLIGVTGIALKISYINDMLKKFRLKHNLRVTFYDNEGNIVLVEKDVNASIYTHDTKVLERLKDKIISKEDNLFEYKENEETYIIKTKYIPELDLYLSVEAHVDSLTKDVQKVFYFNLLISFFITIVITLLILFIVYKNNKKILYLAEFDSLTKIVNRRVFKERFAYSLLLGKRDKRKVSLIFLDIDNFKSINDTFGHSTGDEVLKVFATLIKENIRETDLVGRWGGEEFTILLRGCNKEEARTMAEKLQTLIAKNKHLSHLTNRTVTASFGVTESNQDDSVDMMIQRADNAMYVSKEEGKDRITVV